MLSNLHQLDPRTIDYDTILDSVAYFPVMIDIGSAVKNWSPLPYAKMNRKVLQVSMDTIQAQRSTLMDNVFNVIGVTSFKEDIRILPIIWEMVESKYEDRNLNEIIPMVLTEMNILLDSINWTMLKTIAKQGTAHAFKCGPGAINAIIAEIDTKTPRSMDKVVIIDPVLETCLKGIISADQPLDFLESFKQKLAQSRATLKVCEQATVGDGKAGTVLIVTKPLLAEYTGMVGTVEVSGFDERKKEYWSHFLMSNSDFKARPSGTDAVISMAFTTMDITKIGEKVCPT